MNYIAPLTIATNADIWAQTPREQGVRHRARMRGQLPQVAIAHPLQERPVGNPPGRPAKNMAALLAAALNERGPSPRTGSAGRSPSARRSSLNWSTNQR
jgi:hypothetical protein